jgi:TolB protein
LSPAFSPDGSRIAFSRAIKVNGRGVRTRIEVMSADGHDLHPLTKSGAHRYELDPRWAPSGRHLAFTRYAATKRAFTSSIVVMCDDGSHQQTLARARLGRHARRLIFLGEPTWAPDGEHLIYTKTRLDRNAYYRPSLISITKRGADRHLLVRDAGSAGCSPDGSQIVFSSIKDRNGSVCYTDECEYHGEIYVADADGTDPQRLTDTVANEAGSDWSADGERIVFWSQRGSNRHVALPQVYSIAPSGTCRTRLTRGNPGSSSPDWEPNPALSSDPGGCA